MIFLRYESFRSYLRLYPVTAAIIAINIIDLFLIIVFTGGSWITLFFTAPRGINYFSLQEPWRYVTAVFLHLEFQHLVLQYVRISSLRRRWKDARACQDMPCSICYAGSSAICSVLWPSQPYSRRGCIWGYLRHLWRIFVLGGLKRSLDESSRKTVYTILIFGVIYSIFAPGIGIWAHFGGLFAGFVLGMGMTGIYIHRRTEISSIVKRRSIARL